MVRATDQLLEFCLPGPDTLQAVTTTGGGDAQNARLPIQQKKSSASVSISARAVRPRGDRVQPEPTTPWENTMKYMLIMRANDEANASFMDVDFEKIVEEMGRFNQEMISAGVLVAAEGLDDAEQGVVVDFSSEPPVVTDGPYGETKELFGGFYILEVASKEEAVEWAKRAPMTGPGIKTEIRRVTSIDELPQDNEWIQKERAWREATGQL
jgi:hypothetical protein